ncbi:protein kinase [Nesterenkonia sp. HG001]|nr:protein kinase [Nesterenkonia sp. HG001]MDZ5077405.1 protein kinase [Nesterenkonia sp. HG001]
MTENGHRVLNGRYRIEALIGRGGMADVYLGHDLSLNRRVAVKMLRPDLARDPQFQGRFRREAQSSASLNHHNIVGVYDTGRADVEDSHHAEIKTPYIVMEYVDGVTLRHIMHGTPTHEGTGDVDADDEATQLQSSAEDRTVADGAPAEDGSGPDVLALGDTGRTDVEEHGAAADVGEPLRQRIDEALGRPMPEPKAAEYLDGILGALSYSHEKGIVHRDIKPSNVMVAQNGAVKVMDFGIARALADSASTMTQTSAVVGTAQYLSPEQARGEVVDHRSDLYSAGCVLFELLTNRPPFQGESPVSVAYQHVREDPPQVSDLNPRVSPAMESVVAKALTKDPAARFQNADEFASAIKDALHGVPVEDATAAMPAVDPGDDFDQLVSAGAAGLGTPLSARTPEDPDLYQEPEEEVEEPRRRRGFAWLWVVLLIALVAGGTWALIRMLDTDSAQVPEVEGMTQAEAVAELAEANIEPADIETVPDPAIEADHAIGTDPEAGERLGEDEELILYISAGQDQVTIPDGLQGETQETVRAELEAVGLEVGELIEEDHPTVGADELIATDPEGGSTVELGSEVDLVLGTGLYPVPDVALLSASEARAQLEEAGFSVTDSTVDWTTDAYDAGTVGGTFYGGDLIDPGTPIPQGATVSISLAVAPEPEESPEPEETRSPDDEDEDNGDDDEDTDEDADDEESPTDEPDDEESPTDEPDDEESPTDEPDDEESPTDEPEDEDTDDEDTGNGEGNGNGGDNGNDSDDD